MKINPFKSFIELFIPREVSPFKDLAKGHPKKQYCYTLVGYNDKPLSSKSLANLGFIGKIQGSSDFVIAEDEMLFKELNTVIKIAMFYNIYKIRKYHDTGHGIEWQSLSRRVYEKVMEAHLFPE